MAELKLSDEEAQVLKELLVHKLTDLDVEIHRTDGLEFKEQLRHRRLVLRRICEQISGSSGT